jgi:serine/threonine protein kinase
MRGPNLFIAMRLMNKGSAADVMRYGWPGGMEEEVIRCILKHALEGLKFRTVLLCEFEPCLTILFQLPTHQWLHTP